MYQIYICIHTAGHSRESGEKKIDDKSWEYAIHQPFLLLFELNVFHCFGKMDILRGMVDGFIQLSYK